MVPLCGQHQPQCAMPTQIDIGPARLPTSYSPCIPALTKHNTLRPNRKGKSTTLLKQHDGMAAGSPMICEQQPRHVPHLLTVLVLL